MKYRSKLALLLAVLALTTSGILASVSYWLTRDILVGEIQSKVLSIAATAAAVIDGDLHSQIQSRQDEQNQPYQSIEAQLRRLRDVNRRGDAYIRYIYTVDRPGLDSSPLLYVVDAEEQSTKRKSHVGSPVTSDINDPTPLQINTYNVEPLVTDEFGSWLSASAPIRNHQGRAVASLGVDLAAHDVLKKTNALLWGGFQAMLVALAIALVIALFLSRLATRPIEQISRTINRIGQGDLQAHVDLPGNDEFGQLGQAVNDMAAALRDRELLKGALARYLSYQVAENIIRSGSMPELKGERRKVTILFLDIRNFTLMADNLAPEQVVDVLNQFFGKMIDVIFRHKGSLDKFTGDGLMAIFGAPIDDQEQELHAAAAALDMQTELEKLRHLWRTKGRDHLRIGMGINTGIAVVGNIGSPQRMDYTAIGDTVNLASRLESATKDHGVSILISEQTHVAIKRLLPTRYVATLQVRGRSTPEPVYTLINPLCETPNTPQPHEPPLAIASPSIT
jgi:adenylate cyclase